MRNEDVSGNRAAVEFVSELLTEATKSCTAVENKNLLAGAHLHARGIPSIAEIFRLGTSPRTAEAPNSGWHAPSQSNFYSTLTTSTVHSCMGSTGIVSTCPAVAFLR